MGFGLQWNAWVSMFSSLMIQFCAGNMYLFGTYSETLKEVLFEGDESGQSKLQTIALLGNIWAFMPLAGIFYDSKYGGVTSTVLIGSFFTFAGYIMLYFVVSNNWNCGIVLACVFTSLWGHGAGYYDAAALTTGVKNVPHQRGLVVGAQKAFLGLAGSIVTQASSAFFEGDVANYLLFVSLLCSVPTVVSVVFLCETIPIPEEEAPASSKKFYQLFGLLACVAIMLLISSLLRATSDDIPGSVDIAVFGVGVAAIPALCGLLIRRSGNLYLGRLKKKKSYIEIDQQHHQKDDNDNATTEHPLKPEVDELSQAGESDLSFKELEEVDGVSPKDALKTLDFWLLFAVLGIGTGGGLTIINNSAQIMKAEGGSQQDVDVAASLLFIFNSFGRMILAVSSEKLTKHNVSRALVFSLTILLHGIAHSIMISSSMDASYIGFCLAGLSYGGMQAVFPAVVGDLFGLRFFASNYMWMMFAPSIGSLGFSTILASQVYESHQTRNIETNEVECIGSECYRTTHIVVSVSSLMAFFCGLWLNRRIRARIVQRHSTRLSIKSETRYGTDDQ